jgi:hypothetical protein
MYDLAKPDAVGRNREDWMSKDALATRVAISLMALGAATTAANAADFDWKKFQG